MTFVDACAVVLALVFLVAGVSKLASRSWPDQAMGLGIPRQVARLVPLGEVGLGAVSITGFRRWSMVFMAGLLMAFTAVLVTSLARGRRPPCACFGGATPKPISWRTVVRNAAFLALAVAALAV